MEQREREKQRQTRRERRERERERQREREERERERERYSTSTQKRGGCALFIWGGLGVKARPQAVPSFFSVDVTFIFEY